MSELLLGPVLPWVSKRTLQKPGAVETEKPRLLWSSQVDFLCSGLTHKALFCLRSGMSVWVAPWDGWKQAQHREILVEQPNKGWAHHCSGCPSWLEVLTVFIHRGLSLGQRVMTNEYLEVRAAIKQRHLHGWT